MAQEYLDGLNEAQQQAVTAGRCHVLVVAGAGTGKTRVVVSRIAYILDEFKDPPRSVLAVTFTNKAANELKERVNAVCGHIPEINLLWAGTFHSICARFLRSYAFAANLPSSFTIMDASDVQRELKHICMAHAEERKLNIEARDARKLPRELAEFISKLKALGLRASDYDARQKEVRLPFSLAEFFSSEDLAAMYYSYERLCEQAGMVDFDELLLRTVELFSRHSELLSIQHRRFRHILVDEFQDTNSLQYELVKLLCGDKCCVMAVGDDDQSIYSWRGADYRNMFSFVKDFKGGTIIPLAENYRSSQNILDMANALLHGAHNRLTDKTLITEQGPGYIVDVVETPNNYSEGQWIASTVFRLHKSAGIDYQDMAVLYRFNTQSNALEQALRALGIPYTIWGGLRFFEREEVQNAVAYLRLAVNENDNAAFARILNVPKRKLGASKQQFIEDLARERGCSYFKALKALMIEAAAPGAVKSLKSKAQAFKDFYVLMEDLVRNFEELPFDEALHRMIEVTGILDYYRKKDEDEGKRDNEGRVANLKELENHALRFRQRCEAEPLCDDDGKPFPIPLLFATSSTLSASTEMNPQGGSLGTGVNLSTIHSAKGLEYQVVFVAGFEDGILPSFRAKDDEELEEERRLAYVAVTRAREKLIITYCRRRQLFGQEDRECRRSRFIDEIVCKLREEGDSLPYTEQQIYSSL